ncbi:MAG TPA: hypothetical protein DIV79_09620 [Opitutae bacterium]|nr:hypothetical protein [Opitutaceae bacterium]HCR30261.1 hypothetical protein [Opitutae bacterium]|tara:strand:- start:24 stop:623 length:600 start_codon:yes stop_codon:yes gene_type:complete
MKTTRFILALMGLLVLASSNLQAQKREIPFIYLDQNQILYITVIDNIYRDDGFGGGNVADRYYDIEETLVKVLRETEFPMGYKIVRFGARVPKDQPELQLIITKWGDNRLGEIEVIFNGVLKESSQGRTKNKLGFFRERDGAFPMISQSRTTAKYNEVLSKALVKLIARLNDHFTLEFEGPNLGQSAFPPSLDTPVKNE